ncbi:MAG TPA: alcohol dehydrogenase [Verrucomicrobiae bacterium]|jgi:D-arabinose 1-dehydrogenase-like Zn-dependent alcohol dehydrogenase|nr:alcohol dehydrogenase [Verrucomicrobiae bacterium]
MAKMRVAEVRSPKAPFEIVERDIPEPPAGAVRVKIEACGICHSDSLTKEGLWPGIQYPRVPGHEIAGVIDALGSNVAGWTRGERVGIGWHGGHCGYCDSCRRGSFVTCQIALLIPGISYDGGYADYAISPAGALARIPDGLTFVEAAPLMCAGVTTFNSLRNSGARPGDLVAVLGIGGLGHLGVQFAAKMGCNTVAIARGKDKEELALKLGAARYIDSSATDAAAELMKMGGAKVILATATSGKAMTALLGGLGIDGKLVVLGAADAPIEASSILLIMGRRSITGWPSGSSIDSEDTLAFSALTGIRPMTEVVSLDRAAEGYERMMSGKARFRVVLTTSK